MLTATRAVARQSPRSEIDKRWFSNQLLLDQESHVFNVNADARSVARARRSSAGVAKRVDAAANTPPTVSMISHRATCASYFTAAGLRIKHISATATDKRRIVALVVDFQRRRQPARDGRPAALTVSFGIMWRRGSYTLTAVANRQPGAKATSAPVTITAVAAANALPTVSTHRSNQWRCIYRRDQHHHRRGRRGQRWQSIASVEFSMRAPTCSA